MRFFVSTLTATVAAWFLDVLALATPLSSSLQSPLLRPPFNGVSEDIYSELELFAKYSSAVYQPICPRPVGNTLVLSFSNVLTHTHGFVARDDKRREIVVAFRGSHELADMVTGMYQQYYH
ncbi:hypothetical protein B0F90DRAFT_375725 [Multifurca ochricompacta]|uniref:Uncharacterized protein n=1 Tax=Multifurca ochricompacta TaxID=376703 RepID=A0AAD4M4F4_9AGAM|nr:hypothetical protein B0F90DRAFT_375725 [Multifurca ochricompacta]